MLRGHDPRRAVSGFIPVALAATTFACGGPVEPVTGDDELRQRFGLEPLGEVQYPADNQRNDLRIELGRLLFFDPILGGEQDVACGTCHHPDYHFTDGRQFGAGVSGVGLGPNRHLGVSAITGDPITTASRNTITILNAAFVSASATAGGGGSVTFAPMFWDGRVSGLEAQALIPIGARVEMRGDEFPGIEKTEGYLPGSDEAAAATVDSILNRVRAVPEYGTLFAAAFAGDPTAAADPISRSTLSRAIAAYERELVAHESAFDRWLGGEDAALTATEKQGLQLFFGKATCGACHTGGVLSSFTYRVTGVPVEGPGFNTIPGDDLGREERTEDAGDRYRFKVPGLRNVEITAPYMHSGVFETLDEVVRFYNAGAQPRHPNVNNDLMDAALRQPLGLTDGEISAIVAFLRSLTDPGTGIDPLLKTVPSTVPSGLLPVYGVAGN